MYKSIILKNLTTVAKLLNAPVIVPDSKLFCSFGFFPQSLTLQKWYTLIFHSMSECRYCMWTACYIKLKYSLVTRENVSVTVRLCNGRDVASLIRSRFSSRSLRIAQNESSTLGGNILKYRASISRLPRETRGVFVITSRTHPRPPPPRRIKGRELLARSNSCF